MGACGSSQKAPQPEFRQGSKISRTQFPEVGGQKPIQQQQSHQQQGIGRNPSYQGNDYDLNNDYSRNIANDLSANGSKSINGSGNSRRPATRTPLQAQQQQQQQEKQCWGVVAAFRNHVDNPQSVDKCKTLAVDLYVQSHHGGPRLRARLINEGQHYILDVIHSQVSLDAKNAQLRGVTQQVRASRADVQPLAAVTDRRVLRLVWEVQVKLESLSFQPLEAAYQQSIMKSPASTVAMKGSSRKKRRDAATPANKEAVSDLQILRSWIHMSLTSLDLLRYLCTSERDAKYIVQLSYLKLLSRLLTKFVEVHGVEISDFVHRSFQVLITIGPDGSRGVFAFVLHLFTKHFFVSTVVSGCLISLMCITSHPTGAKRCFSMLSIVNNIKIAIDLHGNSNAELKNYGKNIIANLVYYRENYNELNSLNNVKSNEQDDDDPKLIYASQQAWEEKPKSTIGSVSLSSDQDYSQLHIFEEDPTTWISRLGDGDIWVHSPSKRQHLAFSPDMNLLTDFDAVINPHEESTIAPIVVMDDDQIDDHMDDTRIEVLSPDGVDLDIEPDQINDSLS